MKKNLWIMCGVPGSGKTYIATHFLIKGNSWKYVSRDDIRMSYLKDNDDYFQYENIVYDNFIKSLCKGLNDIKISDVIADATHINWASRRKVLHHCNNMINLNEVNINVVVIKSDWEICIKRNAERIGRARVPEKAMIKMNQAWQHPKTDPFKYNIIIEWNNGVENCSNADELFKI